MSGHDPEDRDLERFLAREDRLQDRWREVSDEEPASAVDAAVRDSARRALASREAGTGWKRWRMPVALAAVVVVSASLTLMLAEHPAPTLQSSAPGSPASPPADLGAPPRVVPVPASPAASTSDAGAPVQAPVGDALVRPTPRARGPSDPLLEGRDRPTRDRPDRDAVGDRFLADRSGRPSPTATAPAPAANPPGSPLPEQTGVTASPVRSTEAAPAARAEQKAEMQTSSEPLPVPGAVSAGNAGQVAERTANTALAPSSERAKRMAPPPEPASPYPAKPAGEGRVGTDRSSAAAVPRVDAAASPAKAATDTAALGEPSGNAMAEESVNDPDRWVERIRSLRRSGQREAADDSLARFKARFPAYPLPADLRDVR